MSLKKIVSISGMPGLYRAIAQTKTGFVVEALADKKRFSTGGSQQVSSLTDISIFTTGEDKKLVDVFKAMKELPEADTKVETNADGATLKNAFKKIVPDYDEERVYASDIKKVFKWFQFIKDMPLDEEPEPGAEAEKPTDETKAPETPEPKN